MTIDLKRVYETPSPTDGVRILVERLWPRGLSKERARVDVWMRDVAPSNGLRRWYQHDTSKWSEFRRRYVLELRENTVTVTELRTIIESHKVTFVFASKEETKNSATVLKSFLEGNGAS